MRAAALRRLPAFAWPRLPGRLRRRLLLTVLAAAVLALAYLVWFRDSGLVRVERVAVSGLTTDDASRIRRALTAAGGQMTTLHVRVEELEAAVAPFGSVGSLEVSADFPRTLRIHVIERLPVALVGPRGGRRVPVAADGTVLDRRAVTGPLPTIDVARRVGERRLADRPALRQVRLVSAAPGALRRRVAAVLRSPGRGIVVRLRDGPELVFGSTSRLRARWAAAAGVLAHPAAEGASYVDLRLPERPAAGGLGTETLAPMPPAGPQSGAGGLAGNTAPERLWANPQP